MNEFVIAYSAGIGLILGSAEEQLQYQ